MGQLISNILVGAEVTRVELLSNLPEPTLYTVQITMHVSARRDRNVVH